MAPLFSKLFGSKNNSVLGVDVGSSSIKIVQLTRKSGKAILQTYGELALGPYSNLEIGRATNLPPEQISTALRDVIRESKVTTKEAGMAIPFGSSLIASLEMPAVAEKDLAQMIPIEARKYIPVPISEVMLDWIIVPKVLASGPNFDEKDEKEQNKKPNPGEKLDILLVAIHNESLSRFQTIVNQGGLETSFFEIEIFSVIRAILDQEVTSQMIIDLGAASTKVYIIERGIIRTSHIINRGSQDVTLAISKSLDIPVQTAEVLKRDMTQIPENRRKDVDNIITLTLDTIFTEAERVRGSYQTKYNKDVKRVILVGGGARLFGINKVAESHLQSEVVLGNPFAKTEAPAFLEQVLRETGPEFAVAVGIALRKLQELG